MTPEEFERERLKSAADLDRVRERAREEPAVRSAESVLGPREPVKEIESNVPRPPEAPAWNPRRRPISLR